VPAIVPQVPAPDNSEQLPSPSEAVEDRQTSMKAAGRSGVHACVSPPFRVKWRACGVRRGHITEDCNAFAEVTVASVTQGYRLEMARSHAVLRLDPEMGSAAWGDIDRVGNELIASVNGQSTPAWLIDLSRLEYMGSALVALVVRVWKAVQNGGGKVVVVCGGGMPQEVLRLAGLDKVWTITTTYEDGLRKLGVSGPSSGGSSSVRSDVGGDGAGGFPLLAVLSLICAVAAGVALALILSGKPINRDLIVAGLLGGGVAAAVLGCVAVIKELGMGRWLGAAAGIAGIAIAAFGWSRLPPSGGAAPAPQKAAEEQPAETQPAETQPVEEQPAASAEKSASTRMIHSQLEDAYA
jgi:anti-anti-sigma factor